MEQKINHILNLAIEKKRKIKLFSKSNLNHKDIDYIKTIPVGTQQRFKSEEKQIIFRPEEKWGIYRQGNTLNFIFLEEGLVVMGSSMANDNKKILVVLR